MNTHQQMLEPIRLHLTRNVEVAIEINGLRMARNAAIAIGATLTFFALGMAIFEVHLAFAMLAYGFAFVLVAIRHDSHLTARCADLVDEVLGDPQGMTEWLA